MIRVSGTVCILIAIENTKLKICILFQKSCVICMETNYSVPTGCKILRI